jgi:hypothetical protein
MRPLQHVGNSSDSCEIRASCYWFFPEDWSIIYVKLRRKRFRKHRRCPLRCPRIEETSPFTLAGIWPTEQAAEVRQHLLFEAPQAISVKSVKACTLDQGQRRDFSLKKETLKSPAPIRLCGTGHFRPKDFCRSAVFGNKCRVICKQRDDAPTGAAKHNPNHKTQGSQ